MICVDFIDAVDIGCDELENEHDVVTFVDIFLLVLLNGSGYFLLLIYLFLHFFDICHPNCFNHVVFNAFFPLFQVVEDVSLNVNISLVKLFIFLDIEP